MKNQSLFAVLLGVLVTGCSTTGNLTLQPGDRTDYVMHVVYEVQKPVFLFKYDKTDDAEIARLEKLGFSGTAASVAEFELRAASHPQVAGLLMPGNQIRITQFTEERSVTIGVFLHVYGQILTGEHMGQIVDLSMISKGGLPGYRALVDLNYLVPLGHSEISNLKSEINE